MQVAYVVETAPLNDPKIEESEIRKLKTISGKRLAQAISTC
jgi:hypothetical protein